MEQSNHHELFIQIDRVNDIGKQALIRCLGRNIFNSVRQNKSRHWTTEKYACCDQDKLSFLDVKEGMVFNSNLMSNPNSRTCATIFKYILVLESPSLPTLKEANSTVMTISSQERKRIKNIWKPILI